MNTIELETLGGDHPLNRAMRRIARHWPVVYSKLLCLKWEWTDDDGGHPAADQPVPYGATDGIHLILNRSGVLSMSEESAATIGDTVGYVAFLLVHEGLHAVLNHGVRLHRLADRNAANEAADYKINEMVGQRNQEIGGSPFPLPGWVLLDTNMSVPFTTEQLYQHLRKNDPDTQPDPTPTPTTDPAPEHDPCPVSGGDDSPDDPEGGGPPDTGDAVDGAGDGLDTGDTDDGGAGTPEPGAQTPDPGDEGSGGDPRPGAGGVDTFKPVAGEGTTQAELESALEEQNERIMLNEALDSRTSGDGSATTQRIVDEREAAETQEWGALVEQFVEVRSKRGWMSPYNHNVYIASGLCAPGQEGRDVGDIVCVADSSGSIGPPAWKRFFELNQWILDDIKPRRLFLISCAEKVKGHIILEPGDTVPTNMGGGGGTSFKAAFDWIADDPHDLLIDPLLLLYFTDGQADDHKTMDEPAYPVLWLSYQQPESHFPWGEFATITLP